VAWCAIATTVMVALDLDKLGGRHGRHGRTGHRRPDRLPLADLVLGSSALLFAERQLEGGVTACGPEVRYPAPGRAARLRQGSRHRVVPLLLFAIGGMMLFPASDLIMMFVALRCSLPLSYERSRPPSPPAQPEAKYFLLGPSQRLLPYGIALI
jgi:hypothetical protein